MCHGNFVSMIVLRNILVCVRERVTENFMVMNVSRKIVREYGRFCVHECVIEILCPRMYHGKYVFINA